MVKILRVFVMFLPCQVYYVKGSVRENCLFPGRLTRKRKVFPGAVQGFQHRLQRWNVNIKARYMGFCLWFGREAGPRVPRVPAARRERGFLPGAQSRVLRLCGLAPLTRGHTEAAASLNSGPSPPNMGRQNGDHAETTYGSRATLEPQLPECSGSKAGG